jgi:uncharacterized membrane protein YsdA (DUF1294 family)
MSGIFQQIKKNWTLARRCWRQTLMFSLIWAIFLAVHTLGSLYWQGWQDITSIAKLTLLIFIGALFGGMLGWFLAILLGAHRIAPKRFAVAFVFILLATVGAMVALFALQFRQYYTQWHMPAFTIGWAYQLVFTGISALYLFAVQGLRLLLPFGPVALVLAPLYFVKTTSRDNSIGD